MVVGRRLKHVGLTLGVLLIPVLLLISGLKHPNNLNTFDQWILGVTAPLQKAVAKSIDASSSLWNRYFWLVDVEDENEELRRENQRLHQEWVSAKQGASDTQHLEKLLTLKERMGATTLGARVITSSMNPHFRVTRMVIDRGEHEVTLGMPVIAADGLVGRIYRPMKDTADVLLLSDPLSSVDVVIERSGKRGILTGLGSHNAYRCEIEYLERGDEVVLGDRIVTSGLGNVFPAGIFVGTVSNVDQAEYGLYQRVEVLPAVNLGALEEALVLIAAPPSPDPDGSFETKSLDANQLGPL